MTNSQIDLHVHSIYSDGTYTPRQLLEIATKKGIRVVSMTDHDSISGINEFLEASVDFNIIALPGVEFSVNDHKGLTDIDLLGYFPDIERFKASFNKIDHVCSQIKDARINRLKEIVEILNNNDIKVDMQQLFDTHKEKNKTIGRKHIADIVALNNPKKFLTAQDVFDNYLGSGCVADVPIRFEITLKMASDLIHECGGVSILAHPGVSNGRIPDKNNGHALIDAAVEIGDVDGVEGYYLYHKNRPYLGKYSISPEENDKLCQEYIDHIKQLDKIYTAGSDCHGDNKNIEIGENCGEYELYEQMVNILNL